MWKRQCVRPGTLWLRGPGGAKDSRTIRGSAQQCPEPAGSSRPGAATAAPKAPKRRGLLARAKAPQEADPLLPVALTGVRPRPRTPGKLPPASSLSGSRRTPVPAAVGLRTAQPPPSPDFKRPGGDPKGGEFRASSAACQLALEHLAFFPALQSGAAHPHATYPVPHHPRGLRRSAEAAMPPVRGL